MIQVSCNCSNRSSNQRPNAWVVGIRWRNEKSITLKRTSHASLVTFPPEPTLPSRIYLLSSSVASQTRMLGGAREFLSCSVFNLGALNSPVFSVVSISLGFHSTCFSPYLHRFPTVYIVYKDKQSSLQKNNYIPGHVVAKKKKQQQTTTTNNKCHEQSIKSVGRDAKTSHTIKTVCCVLEKAVRVLSQLLLIFPPLC